MKKFKQISNGQKFMLTNDEGRCEYSVWLKIDDCDENGNKKAYNSICIDGRMKGTKFRLTENTNVIILPNNNLSVI